MSMKARAREAAKKARCTRCRKVVLESPSAAGTVTGYYRIPALGETMPITLCGEHGIELQEFLLPELVDDPAFQGIKNTIKELWK